MSRFEKRRQEHDKLENRIMDIIRPFTDRKHLPDRRVSFGGIPYSFDVKTNVFVEKNSHDEYFRLWNEGEQVFIVFQDKNRKMLYADWIINLNWSGPHPPRSQSTSGDPYYIVSSQKTLNDFLKDTATMVE